jgi:hypothetical protein
MTYSHMSYFLIVIFPIYKPPLSVKHHAYELFDANDINMALLTTKLLEDKKSILVRNEYQVSSDVYNEVITSHKM